MRNVLTPAVAKFESIKVFVRNKTLFFFIYFLTVVIFLQLANVYAYYIDQKYDVTYIKFASLMLLNAVLTIIFQYFLYVKNHGILVKYTKFLFGLGILLIGSGMFVAVARSGFIMPILQIDLSVVASFIILTLGEVLLFTSSNTLLMSLAVDDEQKNTQNSFTFYLQYYLTGVVSPLIVYMLHGVSYKMMFIVALIACLIMSFVSYFKL